MCGIAGMLGLIPSENTVSAMLSTMHRRGPDARDVYREKDIALLHARLAIIDPEGGKQPMELRLGDRRFCRCDARIRHYQRISELRQH